MKRKILIVYLTLFASVGTVYAYNSFNFMAQVGDFYYGFLRSARTAMVTWPNQTNPNPNRYVGDIVIPDSVTYNDTTYTVVEIGYGAFTGCTNITSVTIPNTITCIDYGAFEKCTKLESVNIPPDILWIAGHTFSECSSLKSITIPKNVSSIGQKAFYKCNKLEIIMLPETPPTIDRYGYPYDWMIPLTIPIRVPCGSKEAYLASDWANYNIQDMPNSFDVNIVSSDSLIGEVISEWINNSECNPILSILATPILGSHFVQWSDGNTDNPRIIELMQDTTFTAEFALDRSGRCGNDSLLTWQYDPATKILSISGDGVFVENIQCGVEARPELEKVIIGEGVTAINTEAFADCPSLTSIEWNAVNGGDYTMCPFPATVTSVTFGAKVEHIPSHLCEGITKMNTLVFPTSLKSIGEYAFKDLTNIKQINIPNEVATIGAHTFDSCIFVTSIYLGYQVSEIGNYAFKGCIRVNDITCMNTTTPVVYSNTLTSISSYAYLYVPEGSKRTYRIDPYWGRFDIHEIASVDTTLTQDKVTVEANENYAIFTWPTDSCATTYSLQIIKDNVVFCTLVFNSNGQLMGIAFAPAHDGSSHGTAATTSIAGMSFTVTGLNAASKYSYCITASDANKKDLVTYRGEFATIGYSGEVNTGGNPERPEGIGNIQERNIPYTKVINNGNIYIVMPNNQIYSITGIRIK